METWAIVLIVVVCAIVGQVLLGLAVWCCVTHCRKKKAVKFKKKLLEEDEEEKYLEIQEWESPTPRKLSSASLQRQLEPPPQKPPIIVADPVHVQPPTKSYASPPASIPTRQGPVELEKYLLGMDDSGSEAGDSVSETTTQDSMAFSGNLGFKLVYKKAKEELVVTIQKATGLPTRCKNPYVSVVLLPDMKTRYLTKVQKHTTDPEFNEIFLFPIKEADIPSRTLRFDIMNMGGKFSKNKLMGTVLYPFEGKDIATFATADDNDGGVSEDLSAKHLPQTDVLENKGDIQLSFGFMPKTDVLSVTVMEAKNVAVPGIDAILSRKDIQLYVRVALFVDNKVIKTKRSVVKSGSTSPVYKQIFNFDVEKYGIDAVGLKVSVCQKKSGDRETLGKVFLGPGTRHSLSATIGTGDARWYAVV
ncbi:synaptotagmin-15-like [Branchiostoma lanceolatum]|uniref:synaptotagmin-15-like n=1 Tax=Branchiostoma lanceolatum TaxID=7740 RepID=UPI0034548696